MTVCLLAHNTLAHCLRSSPRPSSLIFGGQKGRDACDRLVNSRDCWLQDENRASSRVDITTCTRLRDCAEEGGAAGARLALRIGQWVRLRKSLCGARVEGRCQGTRVYISQNTDRILRVEREGGNWLYL